jgi:hypothetical protein
MLPRFPYGVVFVELTKEVRIVAVAHAKRRPGYWLDRTGLGFSEEALERRKGRHQQGFSIFCI